MQTSSCDLARILEDRQTLEMRELLRRLAAQCESDSFLESDIFGYYRGMLSALNEEDFRWHASPFVNRRKLRRERSAQYRHYLELFELEARLTRAQERAGMAQCADWSGVAHHIQEAARLVRVRAQLRLAGIWFRAGIPGARDICDAAAFRLFSASYLAA